MKSNHSSNSSNSHGLQEASKMWQEGWRIAAPYVSKYYSVFVGVMAAGVGLGMFFGSFSNKKSRQVQETNNTSK